jgi:hypothetical protein
VPTNEYNIQSLDNTTLLGTTTTATAAAEVGGAGLPALTQRVTGPVVAAGARA